VRPPLVENHLAWWWLQKVSSGRNSLDFFGVRMQDPKAAPATKKAPRRVSRRALVFALLQRPKWEWTENEASCGATIKVRDVLPHLVMFPSGCS